MGSLKLYGSRFGTSLKCHWLLAELGISYEDVPVSLRDGENRKPEFLKLNPNAEIPTLVDGDFVVYESIAINQYLAEKNGSEMLGKDAPEKALVLQWGLWAAFHINRHIMPAAYNKFRGIQDEKTFEEAKNGFAPYLEIIDRALEGKSYLVGGRFTLAEVNVVGAMAYVDLVGIDYSSHPNLSRWMAENKARPAYRKATAQP